MEQNKIRQIVFSDLNNLWKLDNLCFDKYISFTKEMFYELIVDPDCFGFLIESEDNNLKGFIICQKQNNATVLVITLDIYENYRNQGLGQKLLEIVEYYSITQLNCNNIILQVEVSNINAIRLYSKNSYSVAHKIKNYYGKNRDGYEMIKKLNNPEWNK